MARAKERPRGATWVTREKVFVDRVACPWLIRRFIDPDARFAFVPWDTAPKAMEAKGWIPFDMEGAFYGHREAPGGREQCTFEVLVEEFGLARDAALSSVARIVHAADVTGALAEAPEAAGLKAISWGWRFTHPDDETAVREGAQLYEALYQWARMRLVEERDRKVLEGLGSRERLERLRAALSA